jgi:hypothetical protein
MPNDMQGNYGVSAWSATKFVATGHAAVNFGHAAERILSQRLQFVQKLVSIGWSAVHLKVCRSDLTAAFILRTSIYASDVDGHPTGDPLASASLPSSAVQVDGWYKFDLSVPEMDTPEYGLCLLFWQEGGDEDNYASWTYAVVDGGHGCSLTLDGRDTWTDIPGAHRTVRAASSFDAYSEIIGPDPTHRIITPAAILSQGGQSAASDLSGGTFHNTYLDTPPPPYQYYPSPPESVIRLLEKDLHISYVVDSSGSMGWNDRFSLRSSIISGLHASFKDKFPRNVTYDFVQFGARPLVPISLSIPGKTRGVMVSVDDYDSITGYDADGNPLSGDVRAHMATGISAYGFKGLTSPKYLVYGFDTGWSEFRTQSVDAGWRPMWSTMSPSLSVDENGPGGETCLNVEPVSENDAIRNVYGFQNTYHVARASSDVAAGNTVIHVDDNPFPVGSYIRVASSSGIEQNKLVANAFASSLTLSSAVKVPASISDGALVEQYTPQAMQGWGDTDAFEFFVVDESSGQPIKFFVQTLNGAHVEWTFTPMSEWEMYQLYFLGETAELGIDCLDANGDPLPDGTTVEFYVDKQPTEELDDESETAQKTVALVADAAAGATSILVSPQDVEKFSRGDSIDIVDDDRNAYKVAEGGEVLYHTTVVSSVSPSGAIGIADAMPSAFLVAKHASIITPATEIGGEVDVKASERMPIVANLVDITPILTGVPHDPSLLDPLDPPQADPSADPDAYNAVESMVKRTSVEVMTKNGWAAVRICPITEDKFENASTRDALARSMFNLSERDQVRLKAIDDMEKGEMKPEADDAEYNQQVSTPGEDAVEPVYYDGEPDFTMGHKVNAIGGYASTEMKSFATELSEQTIGTTNTVTYLARKYTVNPVVTMYDDSGERTAVILVSGVDIYFACPIYITNTVDRTVFYRQCQSTDEDGGVVVYDQEVPGTFATDPYDITITYDVTNTGFPASGILKVSVYDLRRTVATRTAADDDLPDIDGCGDDTSMTGTVNEFSTTETGDAYTESTADMLLATDLMGTAEFTVPVRGGVASITLPPLDRVALLEVHAAFELDDGYSKVVNKQKIYYRNPVVVTLNGMGRKTADGETRHDIGASVSWKGVEPAADGTMVNFESEKTQMSPSVSQTISGTASGVLLGPHEPIPAPTGLAALEDTGRGEFEGITAICSYRGFTAKKDGQVEWMREQAESGDNFYFYATGYNTNPDSDFSGQKKMWSDGLDYVTINGDLPASSFRAFPYIDTVADDLIESAMGVVYSGAGLTSETRLPRWSSQEPSEGPYEHDSDVPYGWVSNRMFSNRFIGRPPYREPNPDDPDPCDSPECVFVSLYTRSRKYNLSGVGIDSDHVSFLTSTIGGGQAPIPKPRINLVEPFGVTVYIEPADRSEYQQSEWRRTPNGESPKSPGFDSYSHPLKRDGKSRYLAVAEVTWRDKFIQGRQDNPLPSVSFDIGTAVFTKEGMNFSRLDDRTVCPLDYDSAQSYHLRTSFDTDHFHEVSVDDNGRGATVSTVSYTKGVDIPDHVHAVDIYSDGPVAVSVYTDAEGNSNSHDHHLKSVSIIGIGPISDKTVSLAVKADADYDDGRVLSDGSRISRPLENYAFSYPSAAGGTGGDSGYVLEIVPASNQYVDGKIVSGFPVRLGGVDAGYTMLFHAYIRTPGGDIPVEDGTRIFADFAFYEYNDISSKKEKDDGDLVIVGKDDSPRTVAVLKTSAFIPEIPEELKAENKSVVTSDLHWFPSVSAPSLITSPETDELIFDRVISSFSEVGPSRLNDALAMAARRMITFSSDLASSKKIVVVVSDGAESNSDLSFDQAVSELKAVDVENPVEVVFVKLERTEPYDDLIVRKFTSETSGFSVEVADVEDSESVPQQVYDEITGSPSFDLVTGWYSNIVDFGDEKLFDRIRFSTVTPESSSLTFSVRFSVDGVNFGEWIVLGTGVEFDLSSLASVSRYMEYKVDFRGDPDSFESPTLSSVAYEYYEPRRYTVLFQPMPVSEGSDGYVGEIIFAHHGDVPATSSVTYGIKHSYDTDRENYWSAQQPAMSDGYSGIVLSRVNELLIRRDADTFVAAYGGWGDEYDVSVYRISVESKYGSVVPSTSYTYDGSTGTVVFGQEQPTTDVFTITLGMKPVFRIAVDIVNRGPASASIDYIGTMYRPVDKSFMYDNDRRPVYSALDTDFVKLGIEPSATLSLKSVVYNNLVGTAMDIFVDCAVHEGVQRLLVRNGEGMFVIPLRENLTAISREQVTGVVGTPVSCAYMDDSLYVCVLDGDRHVVHRLDASYASMYSTDIGTRYSSSGVIRSKLDLWYVTDGHAVSVRNRSFREISSIPLPSAMSGMFYVDDGFSFVSQYGDALIGFSSAGDLNRAYIIGERVDAAGNAVLIDGVVTVVRSTSVSTYA